MAALSSSPLEGTTVPHFDQSSAECLIFTYKDGLLSAIAHDLMIRVTRFDVEVDDQTLAIAIRARFDASSLRVVSALQGGSPAELLNDSDKRKIEQNIVDEVLEAATFPEIRFVSSSVTKEDGGFHIEGSLTLHGQTRSVSATSLPAGERQVARIAIQQPDYGIKPYSAMLGTLKLKPEVTVQITLPQVGPR
jgi:hypothetical protein